METKQLIELAKKAAMCAYAPYSKFKVGVALLGVSGKVYTGCNIENASYGACLCAERTAIAKAVSESERQFQKIAIVNTTGTYTYPCGICRQVLWEFMPEGEVIVEENGDIRSETVKQLLPNGFSLERSE